MDEPFAPLPLPNHPNLFSPDELETLSKWGAHAEALHSRLVQPKSDKENYFLSVCTGARPPCTPFHYLWLRYLGARAAEEKISNYYRAHRALCASAAEADALRQEITRLQDDVTRLSSVHKSTWHAKEELSTRLEQTKQTLASKLLGLEKLVEKYEIQLGIRTPAEMPASVPPPEVGWVDEWREQK